MRKLLSKRNVLLTVLIFSGLLFVPGVVSRTAFAATASFGNTTIGTSTSSPGANYKFGSVYSLAQDGTSLSFSWYTKGGAAAQRMTPVVYSANTSGSPTTLIAKGAEVTIAANQAAGWVTSALPAVALAKGSYLLGLMSGPTGGQVVDYQKPSANASIYNANAYGSPTSSWGAVNRESGAYSFYVTYSPAVPVAPPVNTDPPVVTGTSQVGQALTASPGAWSNTPSGYSYQWQNCVTATCTDIAGANVATYVPVSTDIGDTLQAVVTAVNGGGSTKATSAPTPVVQDAPAAIPTNQAVPTISGTAQVGQTLTARLGTWNGNPTPALTLLWQNCQGTVCTAIPDATATTYVAKSSDLGLALQVVVTATNSVGTATANSASSAAVAPVPVAPPVPIKIMPMGDSITQGTNSTDGGGYRSYLWNLLKAGGYSVDFVGSLKDGPTTIDRDHEGHYAWETADLINNISTFLTNSKPDIILLLTGSSDLEYGETPQTAATRLGTLLDMIHSQAPNTTVIASDATPEVGISGNGKQQAYNALVPAVISSRVNQGYKLYPIKLSTAMTLNDLSDGAHPNDRGYSKLASAWYPYVTAVLNSTPVPAPTSSDSPPVNQTLPAISGVAQVGQTLTAAPGVWSGSPVPTSSEQWQNCQGTVCSNIAGATSGSYVLTGTDLGDTVRVVETAVNGSGSVSANSSTTAIVTNAPVVAPGTIGVTTVGSASSKPGYGYKFGSISATAASALVNEFKFYARGGSAAQALTPVIYNVDTSGNPTTLVAKGAVVTVAANQAAGWLTSPLSASVTLQPGKYVLALLPGNTSSSAFIYYTSSTNAGIYNNNGSTTPSSTWGQVNREAFQWSYYVDFQS
jgi:lysophospholipase L1-like esterase